MKTKGIAVCIAVTGSLGVGVFDALAWHEVSASVEIRAETDFYAPLEAQCLCSGASRAPLASPRKKCGALTRRRHSREE
jgi:hypothetical protein